MRHTRTFTVGLVLAGLLGLSDVATWLFGVGGPGQPPVAAAAVITLLGAITLAGTWLAWRGRRGGLVAVVVSRILSGLAMLPAFGDDTISTANEVLLGVGLAVTVAALALIWPGLRRPAVAAS
ncbi:hypothetical protein ONA91_23575 [Micromonospora sp. DR5-3]|uniref:hypothetical protein n=1 Tax=unclassified Micromonospora TaxID=2617518 RepID=UPI0011D80651|nr:MULTISPECIES: hypothetical protein [unclassified Micromonospora]MCW3817436.1 hypothetical protein [Micromonospora sp. DR5-3]TYC22890.1 hypothetical protein FXF52_18320 [Micromonospora sp. MP36]